MNTLARVIDFETTGTPEDTDAEIIELGRIDVNNSTLDVINPWTSLCRPRGSIPAVTKAVHHIPENDVRDAPALREVWDEFLEGCTSSDYLVAHNADFEKHFYDGEGRQWIDTYKVARIVWPDAPTHSNQGLRYWLDLAVEPEKASPPHRALPDAYVTAHLFVRLMAEKSLKEMVTISQYPALLRVMNFGKLKGTKFEDAGLDYLEWIRDMSDLNADTKFSARYWIQKRRAA